MTPASAHAEKDREREGEEETGALLILHSSPAGFNDSLVRHGTASYAEQNLRKDSGVSSVIRLTWKKI